ncbi:MAG: hypothetical protein IH931_05960 [candidate division Zixibacteria bacterium]|nr:hypothetical protein [candidate division Zixibacteria bacterium]
MFDNRLVIESPGGFPTIVTSQNIYDMHHLRNPHLMNVLFYLEFVKCAHEGTRRMRDIMKATNLPAPEFSQKELEFALVRVTLRNNIAHRKVFIDTEAAKIVGEAIFGGLNELERRIINYLAEHHRINVSDTQRLTSKSWPACKRLLTGLVDKHILIHKHKDPETRDSGAYFMLRPAKNDVER